MWLVAQRQGYCTQQKTKVHLDHKERSLMMKIRNCTQQLRSLKNPSRNFSPTADLVYAFGVKANVVRTCVLNKLKNNGSNKCKQ
jgi:hypothetical protein